MKILILAGPGGMDSFLDDQMAGMEMKIRVILIFARIVTSSAYISEELVLAYI